MVETRVVFEGGGGVSPVLVPGMISIESEGFVRGDANQDGGVVDGESDRIADVVDIWTYERNTRSSDPNWVLVATETPQ